MGSFPVASRPSSSRQHQEHCKVITVSFAIGPLVKHYGHKSLTAWTQYKENQDWTFLKNAFHLAKCPSTLKKSRKANSERTERKICFGILFHFVICDL